MTSSQSPANRLPFPQLPAQLTRTPRWLLWRYAIGPDGRRFPRPFQPSGAAATPSDNRTLSSFDAVMSAYDSSASLSSPNAAQPFDGIGFVLGHDFTALELDGVLARPKRAGQAPALLPWAAEMVAQFATYTEVSPSGDGLKLLFRGKFPGPAVEPVSQPGGGTVRSCPPFDFICLTGQVWRDPARPVAAEPVLANSDARLFKLAQTLRREHRTARRAEQRARRSGAAVLEALRLDDESLFRLAEAVPVSGFCPPPGSQLHPSAADQSLADQLVDLAFSQFRFGRTRADETFAVERAGPNVARLLRGGADALRAILTRRARRLFGRSPSPAAIATALHMIHAEAGILPPEDVPLRLAHLPVSSHDTSSPRPQSSPPIVIDLGRVDGKVAIVDHHGWSVVDRSPILFRRSALTGEFPLPERCGKLDLLRSLINVSDDLWPVLRGWLVTALFPTVAHPVLLLGGLQGAGKSTALRILAGLVDPSPAPLRTEPRDPEQWAVMAAGSWCIPLDNVSAISPWFSDALCKAVTGDGIVRRRLHTDGDLTVLEFRAVATISSIDAGALRGDLAGRLLTLELDPIDGRRRQSESQLIEAYEQLKPLLFGALLDELSKAIRFLPDVRLAELPRMADFARIITALDLADAAATTPSHLPADPASPANADANQAIADANQAIADANQTVADANADAKLSRADAKNIEKIAFSENADAADAKSLATYLLLNSRLAAEIVDGDPLARAIVDLVQTAGNWEGTAAELLSAVAPDLGRGQSHTPRTLSGKLKRFTPALGATGIAVEYRRDNDRTRTRRIRLSAT